MPQGATFFDQSYFPYINGFPENYDTLDEEMGRVLWSRYVHSPWDHTQDPDFWKTLREKTLQLRASKSSIRYKRMPVKWNRNF